MLCPLARDHSNRQRNPEVKFHVTDLLRDAGASTAHTGCHREVQSRILESEFLCDIIPDIKTKSEGHNCSRLNIGCEHETHRSVAVAVLVKKICYPVALVALVTVRTIREARSLGLRSVS